MSDDDDRVAELVRAHPPKALVYALQRRVAALERRLHFCERRVAILVKALLADDDQEGLH